MKKENVIDSLLATIATEGELVRSDSTDFADRIQIVVYVGQHRIAFDHYSDNKGGKPQFRARDGVLNCGQIPSAQRACCDMVNKALQTLADYFNGEASWGDVRQAFSNANAFCNAVA
jgi:hypothetical protein